MDSSDGAADTPGSTGRAAAPETKPKRTRSGCLTCRERHLKCDEGKPVCNNCKRSNRQCKTGLRINWIYTEKATLPYEPPRPREWQVAFQDDSREIASEYKGGQQKYDDYDAAHGNFGAIGNQAYMNAHNNNMGPPSSSIAQKPLPSVSSMLPDPYQTDAHNAGYEPRHNRAPSHHHSNSYPNGAFPESTVSGANTTYSALERSVSPCESRRDYLNSQDEVLFMQVFVEEVGLWMDSMDPQKHFSRLLPFQSLSEPMLLHAFLACGARHMALVNPKYSEDQALHYYDTATRYLLDSLQNPDRNTVICATTAVILNVYEIMCERALQRMNHIAGARALIKECGWNAKSTGIGAACFWLNVGMELLSCLHFNWQVAWDPDDWGLDMDLRRNDAREDEPGNEELWTYRIVYVVAKVANFRATIPRNHDPNNAQDQMRAAGRVQQWETLKAMADRWNKNTPRKMHPLGILPIGQTLSGSSFPDVWLVKRASIVARLFFHTCMCLLAQIHPFKSPHEGEMRNMLENNSLLICGIVAHVKDRGVASVALRSLAIAAECLTSRRQQEEVLQIFTKIRQETGWRVGFLNDELKQKWGWNEQQDDQNVAAAAAAAAQLQQHQQNEQLSHQQQIPAPQVTVPPPAPPGHAPPLFPPGLMNPLLATADFNHSNHPYPAHYVPPNPAYQPAVQHVQAPSYPNHLDQAAAAAGFAAQSQVQQHFAAQQNASAAANYYAQQ
ncbi:hypothetical protein BU24DRAFT_67612 [Aaosphaeria arxii CBS 175.79]|uniref:Zn(2)-C6 fungal-type domain-containing protein n=1 Tax=Aaosphaeria arxii CBS 175.79 TaxID=1450172 RepID=A0A6A5XAJ2_9PLEO|nr:uncharacterized protein BU24DRAFT_67612 [Aaosphaeria arxii CBS 175.79]KAF2009929.1 hypothetical protein BU24DRAFT_67612 [Aaosphaeria arxii CBS 175.79]